MCLELGNIHVPAVWTYYDVSLHKYCQLHYSDNSMEPGLLHASSLNNPEYTSNYPALLYFIVIYQITNYHKKELPWPWLLLFHRCKSMAMNQPASVFFPPEGHGRAKRLCFDWRNVRPHKHKQLFVLSLLICQRWRGMILHSRVVIGGLSPLVLPWCEPLVTRRFPALHSANAHAKQCVNSVRSRRPLGKWHWSVDAICF